MPLIPILSIKMTSASTNYIRRVLRTHGDVVTIFGSNGAATHVTLKDGREVKLAGCEVFVDGVLERTLKDEEDSVYLSDECLVVSGKVIVKSIAPARDREKRRASVAEQEVSSLVSALTVPAKKPKKAESRKRAIAK